MTIEVYRCLNCGMLVDDPRKHSAETGHIKGYRKIFVPISV